MSITPSAPFIAVACGGTGGHLFPGIAVAEVLQQWGCEVGLLVSHKEVDQEAVKSAVGMRVSSLPAVGLQKGQWLSFARGFCQSYWVCRRSFGQLRPRAVLAMGGFTSAPPVLAGRMLGASTFLHESNSVPGRANRWLAPWVDEAFVGFAVAAKRLRHQTVRVVGTPVRSQFKPSDPGPCRIALGLEPHRPVLLVMGGSQGAKAINELVTKALPQLTAQMPELQLLHLTGPQDYREVQAAYAAQKVRGVVRPFLTEMDLALGAATVAVNRAGASSLSESAAVQVPAILIPYPHATDNHQFHNARAVADSGAARLLEQNSTSPELLATTAIELLKDGAARAAMQQALARWYYPNAATDIAGHIFRVIKLKRPDPAIDSDELDPARPALRPPPNWSGRSFKLETAQRPPQ